MPDRDDATDAGEGARADLPAARRAAARAVARLLDAGGRVTVWPSKQGKKQAVLAYLATHFEVGRDYSEAEVNARLSALNTFGDHALLRRELFDRGWLERTADGSRYWRGTPGRGADLGAGAEVDPGADRSADGNAAGNAG
jgi:hypothetical protein